MSTSPIPEAAPDGLYWYVVPGQEPEPVLVNRARYGERFKAFNGREQAWLRDGERLFGPIAPPTAEMLSEVEQVVFTEESRISIIDLGPANAAAFQAMFDGLAPRPSGQS